MRRTIARAGVAAVGALAIAAGTAGAHPSQFDGSDSFLDSALDEHAVYGHGAESTPAGRLTVPAAEENLELVGKVINKPEWGQLGRIADVSARGHYAYLTMFYEPECGRGGVQIVDIADPTEPEVVGFVPSHVDTFSGEGSQVVTLNTPHFKGDLLVYQNEWCPNTTNGVGGITLVDVSNPRSPKKLVEGAGDFTYAKNATSKGKAQTKANQTHSAFAWKHEESGRWYVALVDDMEEPDVDVLDITNPSRPVKVNEMNFDDETTQEGAGRPHGDSVFSHDLVVKRINGRDIMLLSYWDGGYVQVDVTDPKTPKYLSDTEFAAVDPAGPGRGLTPEGNAHQAEFSRDNQYFAATDEDFDPFRVVAKITAGPHSGSEFTAIQAGDAKPITGTTTVVGATQFLGLACDAGSFPAATDTVKIAVIERGVCDFQVKIDLAKAAGYTSVIVFNRTGEDGCETLVNMLAVTDIPAIFVSRTDGFRILGASLTGYTCDATAAAGGTATPATRSGAAGEHRRDVRRLGVHAPVQERWRPPGAGRLLRPAREPGPGVRRGLRRHDRPRGRRRPGPGPVLRLALRARHAGARVRQQRLHRGRQVRRGGRLELLGRRGPRDGRPDVRPGLRPRPRAAHLPVHDAAAAVGHTSLRR